MPQHQFSILPARLLQCVAKGKKKNQHGFYLDNLAWYKRQLLCSRLIVGRHCSRVVWVKGHKESDRGCGHLAQSLKFPFSEILWSSNPHFIWEYQNIQLQPRLHLQQSERSTVHRQMAAVDSRPLLTLILI